MLSPALAPVLTGAVLGLSVAAPFGPIALLCVQRSLLAGPGLGIATGLGAACVQGLYAMLAITGAGLVAADLAAWSQPVRLLSAVLLVLLGLRVLVRAPHAAGGAERMRVHRAFVSSFAVALCNPLTIMPYLLVASGAAADPAAAALTPWSVAGVLAGATGWYALISGGASLFRSGLPPVVIRGLNWGAGAVLIGFGAKTAFW